MRTIKFRGRRLDNGEWVYGELCTPRLFDSKRGYSVEDVPCIFCDEGNVPIISESVGQFTGLRDKNGKEIYEGDILLCKGNHLYQVEWLTDCFMMRGNIYGGITSISSFLPIQREVIGNIHDNLELLNKK